MYVLNRAEMGASGIRRWIFRIGGSNNVYFEIC